MNHLEVLLLKHQEDENSLVGTSPGLTSKSRTGASSSPPSHFPPPPGGCFPLGYENTAWEHLCLFWATAFCCPQPSFWPELERLNHQLLGKSG